ncbi:hypothetical protein P691DRAFT_638498, partial [Macrolepiota fuliginosa MF-IS2]
PGVRAFVLRMKNAVMMAHDSILAHRVKEIRTANRRQIQSPFKTGDMVYVSAKNISLPKGYSRKLAPRFLGPYRILE